MLKKIGEKFIKLVNSTVNLAVLLALLFLLLVGIYSLWDSRQVIDAASTKQYEMYKPSNDEELPSFEDLVAINPDVMGWLTVNDTGIDYPLVQSKDNDKYINTDVYGKYSVTGSLFLDHENQKDFSDFNTIIYGHHMAANAMFGPLDKFSDKSYFDSHPYGNLYFDGKDHGLEFFAFLEADAYDAYLYTPAIPLEGAQNYLDYLLSMASNRRDIGVTTEDHIVLLSTCSSDETNGRYILVGRLSDKLYPQAEKEKEEKQYWLEDVGNRLTLGMKVWIGILLLILLLLLCYLIERHKRKKREREEEKLEEGEEKRAEKSDRAKE